MDINFHYFTVKTLALEAGFNDQEAQVIAMYSQFVDDYNIWMNLDIEEVPEYARGLAAAKNGKYSFYTVTTGFTDTADAIRLSNPKYQREIVVPFHFIPYKKLKDYQKGEKYRTVPAKPGDGSLIALMLEDARVKYEQNHGRYELMRMGMLLHIFADTYAHQKFSGFHGWENFSYLEEVKDGYDSEKDITKSYNPNNYYKLSSIGHTNISHVPDDTFAVWKMKYAETEKQKKKESYTGIYERNNRDIFWEAAEQIYFYLCQCSGKRADKKDLEELWPIIVEGFGLHSKDEDVLADEWERIYCHRKGIERDENHLHYFYSKEEFWKDAIITETYDAPDMEGDLVETTVNKTASEDFFRYNLIAKEIRDWVIE